MQLPLQERGRPSGFSREPQRSYIHSRLKLLLQL